MYFYLDYDKIMEFPCVHRVYPRTVDFENEYRNLPVKNYLVFYTVDEEQKTVEIYRVLYAKRDWKNIIIRSGKTLIWNSVEL